MPWFWLSFSAKPRRCIFILEKKTHKEKQNKTKIIPHVIAHKLATTIARKRKRVDKGVTGSQEPQLKKASVDTGALIDGSGIVLD